MTKYVASTMTSSVEYVLYSDSSANELPQARAVILVEGGANVATKNLITPHGVITPVTDEEADLLEQNEVFKLQKKAGYIQILESKPRDPDDVAADMTARDPSAPLVDADFKEGQAPTTGKRK